MAHARDAFQALSAAVAFAAAPLLLAPVAAQEYCVACTGPDAVYRCVIDQAVPTGMPLKMLCISTLARDGAHATCAVRSGTVFDCSGPVRRIDARAPTAPGKDDRATVTAPAAGPAPAQAAAPPATAAQALKETQPRPGAKAATADPQTVEALAKQMSKSSSDALGNAGDAIAGSTKKAWGCVTSFFKSC